MLGLIFLKFADSRFAQAEAELAGKGTGRREIGKADYQARGRAVPARARPGSRTSSTSAGGRQPRQGDQRRDGGDRGGEPGAAGVLPRTYQSLTNDTLVSLLRSVNAILGDIEGDAFGKIYEYFLGKFAMAEGRRAASSSRRPRSSG